MASDWQIYPREVNLSSRQWRGRDYRVVDNEVQLDI